MAETFVLSWQNDEYTHILLILPLAVILLSFSNRRTHATPAWDLHAGLGIVMLAIAMACCAGIQSGFFANGERVAIWMSALVVWWIGSAMICFGRRTCARQVFPLLLLFGLVPLPKVILDYVVILLQKGTAYSSHLLFALFNVPVIQHGVQLTLPGLTIEIAQECSSIRSSSMLLVTSLILAQVLLISPGRKALAVALAIPLSVAKNGFRVFLIAILATKVDPGYLSGRLHHQGGILFFLGALAVDFLIVLLLRRREALPATLRSELLPGVSETN